jgi:hypothetical protein
MKLTLLLALLVVSLSVGCSIAATKATDDNLGKFLKDQQSYSRQYAERIDTGTIGVVAEKDADTVVLGLSVTLAFRAFDVTTGQLIASADITPRDGVEYSGVHDPVFAVTSDGNIHIFWLNRYLGPYGAIVDKNGHIQLDPHYVGTKYQQMAASFCAAASGDRTYVAQSFAGYVNGYSGGEGQIKYYQDNSPLSGVLVMDAKQKLVHDYWAKNVVIHKQDAIAVDQAGRIHLVFNNSDQVDHKPGESVIERVTLGPDGKEEERHEVCRVRGLSPGLAASPDPQGTLNIYYTYCETDKGGKGGQRLGHVTEKCKEPTKGTRVPLMLISGGRIYKVDKAGAESSVDMCAPKRPSRRLPARDGV